MNLIVRPATYADAEEIAPFLREEDKREIETATGQPSWKIVPLSFQYSDECYTVRLRNEADPCVIFGRTHGGIVWMLCTNDIQKAPLSILREARIWIDHWLTKVPALYNRADLRNDLHIRWLQLLGFSLGDTVDVNGHSFIHFSKQSDVRTN